MCDAQEGVDQRVDPQRPQGGVGEASDVLRRRGGCRHRQQGAAFPQEAAEGAEGVSAHLSD